MSELNVTALSPTFVAAEKEDTVKASAEPVTSQVVAKELAPEKAGEVEESRTLSPTEAQETVQEVNDILQSMQRNLSFSFDEQLGESVIMVKDSESEEVIRQIPSEELVVLRKKMDDVVGILFDTKV